MQPNTLSWKVQLVKAYTSVPKSFREAAWKIGIFVMASTSALTGFYLWKNPQIIVGISRERMSPVEIMTQHDDVKDDVYELMENFFNRNRPHGLMFVSWEDINSFIGLWVRPADEFPGKAGPHGITPDIRTLGGPFLFGECAHTESLAMPGKTMVACPIINSYDIWGYVAAIVDDNPADIQKMERLLSFLAYRITGVIY